MCKKYIFIPKNHFYKQYVIYSILSLIIVTLAFLGKGWQKSSLQ
jgi:hypothetical protein